MKEAPLTENQGESSSETDAHSGLEQVAHAAGEVLNVAEKGQHLMGKHVPGILGPITKAVEIGTEIMAQHTEDPVANVVCGTVTAAAKMTAGVATMAATVAVFRAAPQIVAPLVKTAIGEAVVTGGLGFAAHHVFDPIVNPVGDAVNRVCHRAVAKVREVTNTPCVSYHSTVSNAGVDSQQNSFLNPIQSEVLNYSHSIKPSALPVQTSSNPKSVEGLLLKSTLVSKPSLPAPIHHGSFPAPDYNAVNYTYSELMEWQDTIHPQLCEEAMKLAEKVVRNEYLLDSNRMKDTKRLKVLLDHAIFRREAPHHISPLFDKTHLGGKVWNGWKYTQILDLPASFEPALSEPKLNIALKRIGVGQSPFVMSLLPGIVGNAAGHVAGWVCETFGGSESHINLATIGTATAATGIFAAAMKMHPLPRTIYMATVGTAHVADVLAKYESDFLSTIAETDIKHAQTRAAIGGSQLFNGFFGLPIDAFLGACQDLGHDVLYDYGDQIPTPTSHTVRKTVESADRLLAASEKIFTAVGEILLSADRDDSALPHSGGMAKLSSDLVATKQKTEKTTMFKSTTKQVGNSVNDPTNTAKQARDARIARGDAETARLNRVSATSAITPKRSVPLKKNQMTRLFPQAQLSEKHQKIQNYAEELFVDEGMSLDDIAQKMQAAMQSPIDDIGECLKHQRAPDNLESAKKFSSVCDDVAGVAHLGSTIANLLGDKKKAAAFSQIATGSAMTGMAATALATSGFSIGAGALLLTGLLQTTGGLADLFGEEDEPGPNPIVLMLEQLAMGLAKISQQIIQLGKYIESRFDELKHIVGTNHQEAMQFMRQLWLTQALSDVQLKTMLKEKFSKVDQKLQSLQTTLYQMQEKASRDVEIRISDRMAQMQEFHYLQTLLDRRLVNEVETVMQRPDELLQRLADYSRQLMQSIKTECRGSQTLTGGDLPVNFSKLNAGQLELLRSRWLYTKPQGLTTHSVYATAAYQIDALMAFAQNQQAVRAGITVTPLPNLVLLTDRVRAFSKLLRTYAEKTRNIMITDPHASIIVPLSVKRDMEEVLAVLQTTIQLLRNIESKKIVEGGLEAMQAQIKAMQSEVGKSLIEFKQQRIKECMSRRVTRLEQLRELLQSTPPVPKVVIPEQNKVFSYALRPMNLIPYGILNNDDNVLRASLQENSGQFLNIILNPHWSVSESLWMGGYDATWRQDIQHSPWHLAGKALFQEKLKTWKPTHEKVVNGLSLAQHVVGSESQENSQTMRGDKERTKQGDQAFIKRIQVIQNIKPVEVESGFCLYSEQFFIKSTVNGADSWKRACTLGPRIVLPAIGETIKFPLYLHDSSFDKFIPESAFLAEDMGLGQLDFRYEIKLRKIDENSQEIQFNLCIQFILKAQMSSASILLFNRTVSCNVSTVYTNLEDAVWRCWSNEPVFTGERIDLSCDLFDHTNPFFKRKSYNVPNDFAKCLVISSQFEAAKTALDKLVESARVQWRNDCNAQIKQQVKGYEGKVGAHLIQADSLLMMTRCWLRLLTPTVYETSQEALLKKLELIAQIEEYVDTFDAKNYNGISFASYPPPRYVRNIASILAESINQIATAKTQLVASLAEETHPGDQDLITLYDGLIALQTRLLIEEPKAEKALDDEREDKLLQQVEEQGQLIRELTEQVKALYHLKPAQRVAALDDEETDTEDEDALEQITKAFFDRHDYAAIEDDDEDDAEEEAHLWSKPQVLHDQVGKRLLNNKHFTERGQRPTFFRYLKNEAHYDVQQPSFDGETYIVAQLATKRK